MGGDIKWPFMDLSLINYEIGLEILDGKEEYLMLHPEGEYFWLFKLVNPNTIDVYQYSLKLSWDISSAVFDTEISLEREANTIDKYDEAMKYIGEHI